MQTPCESVAPACCVPSLPTGSNHIRQPQRQKWRTTNMSEFEKLRQQELAKLMATPLSLLSPEAKMKIANHVNSPIRKRRGVPDDFAFALTLAENASMTPIQKLEAYNGALAAHLNKAVADVATTDNVDRDRVVYREHGEKAV